MFLYVFHMHPGKHVVNYRVGGNKIVCITVENSTWLDASLLKYTRFNILRKRNFFQVDFKKSKLTNSHYRNFRIQIVFSFSKFKFSQQPKEIFLGPTLLRCKGNWMLGGGFCLFFCCGGGWWCGGGGWGGCWWGGYIFASGSVEK